MLLQLLQLLLLSLVPLCSARCEGQQLSLLNYKECGCVVSEIQLQNHLDCSGAGFSYLPEVFPAWKMQHYYQTASGFSEVKQGALRGMEKSAISIHLGTTLQLRLVDERAFENFTQLRQLSLEGSSQLELLETSAISLQRLLKLLPKLRKLQLRHLRVASLSAKFGEGSGIEELELVRCGIISIAAGAFSGAGRLQQLALRNMSLSETIERSLETPPTQLRQLRITRLGLTSLQPPSGWWQLKELDASDNPQLRRIDFSLLRPEPRLRRLLLRSTSVTSSSLVQLGKMLQLEELVLLNCAELGEVPPAVRDMQKLQKLDISMTSIETLLVESFNVDSSLKQLLARRTRLVSIQVAAFSRLKQLESLSLSPSRSVPHSLADAIVQSASSKHATLGDLLQRTTKLTSLSLQGVANMRHLGLNDSVWLWLQPCAKTLRSLDLSFNSITSLPDFFLQQFPNLQELRLVGNLISSVTSASLFRGGQLQLLHLHSNRLATLSPCSLSMISDTADLRVSPNQFACNCSVLWLFRRLRGDSEQRRLVCKDGSRPSSEAEVCDNAKLAADLDASCKVVVPTTQAASTTATPSVGSADVTPAAPQLQLSLAAEDGGHVLVRTDAYKLRNSFAKYIVHYGPSAGFPVGSSRYEAAISTRELHLRRGDPSEKFKLCILLVANATLLLGNEDNCRQLPPQKAEPQAAQTAVIIAASAGGLSLLLLAVLVIACCCRCMRGGRRKEAPAYQQAPIQMDPTDLQQSNPYSFYGNDELASNPRFQPARKPDSRRFTRRSCNNLAGSRPSLAGSASSLHALGAQPQQMRPNSSFSMNQQLQQQQQHLMQQMGRSTEQLAMMRHSQSHLQRQYHSQENILNQQLPQEEQPPPLPPPRQPSMPEFQESIYEKV